MYFGSYGLRKPWLDKCVKGRISEDPGKSNIADGPIFFCIFEMYIKF